MPSSTSLMPSFCPASTVEILIFLRCRRSHPQDVMTTSRPWRPADRVRPAGGILGVEPIEVRLRILEQRPHAPGHYGAFAVPPIEDLDERVAGAALPSEAGILSPTDPAEIVLVRSEPIVQLPGPAIDTLLLQIGLRSGIVEAASNSANLMLEPQLMTRISSLMKAHNSIGEDSSFCLESLDVDIDAPDFKSCHPENKTFIDASARRFDLDQADDENASQGIEVLLDGRLLRCFSWYRDRV